MPDTMTVNGAEYTVRRLLGTLYYIDYECNAYMEQWDFEHWGPGIGRRRHREGRRKHENPLGGQTPLCDTGASRAGGVL